MTGALHRLAMRTLPAAGGVRPRLASRFEGFATPPDAQPAGPAPVPESSPSPVPVARDFEPRPTGSPLRVRQPTAPKRAAARSHATRERESAPAETPTGDDPTMAVQPERRCERADAVQAPRPRIGPAPPVEAVGDSAEPPPLRVERSATVRPPPEAPPPPAAAVAAQARLRAPEPAEPASPRAEAPTQPLLLPPTREPATVRQPRIDPDRTAPAQPDVQVTIGHIEIRAERTERPPPPPPRARPALMSLEDYLGKRRAGR